jgi:hypothetical protein
MRENIIEEIRQRQGKIKVQSSVKGLFAQIDEIEYNLKSMEGKDRDMLRFFSVSLVAIIESFFRLYIMEIVNRGEPYTTNSEDVINSLQIEFSLLKKLQDGTLTIGEFISRLVTISQLKDIDRIISTLIGKKFLKELQLDSKDISRDIDTLFKLRDKFIHEISDKGVMSRDRNLELLKSLKLFLRLSNLYLKKEIYDFELDSDGESSDVPHFDYASRAKELLIEIKDLNESTLEEMSVFLKERGTIEAFTKSREKFLATNQLWKQFVIAQADFNMSEMDSTAKSRAVYSKTIIRLGEKRKRYLQNLMEFYRTGATIRDV